MNIPLSQTFHYWTSTIWTPLALLALASSLNCILHENKIIFGVAWIVIAAVLTVLAHLSVKQQFAWDCEDE